MASNKAFNNLSSSMTYAQMIERIISIALNTGYTITNPVTVVLDIDNRSTYGSYSPVPLLLLVPSGLTWERVLQRLEPF